MQYSKSCVPRLLFFSGQQHFNFYKQQHNKQHTTNTWSNAWFGLVGFVFHIRTIYKHDSINRLTEPESNSNQTHFPFYHSFGLAWFGLCVRMCERVLVLGLIWSCYNVCSAFRIRGLAGGTAVAVAAEHTSW